MARRPERLVVIWSGHSVKGGCWTGERFAISWCRAMIANLERSRSIVERPGGGRGRNEPRMGGAVLPMGGQAAGASSHLTDARHIPAPGQKARDRDIFVQRFPMQAKGADGDVGAVGG